MGKFTTKRKFEFEQAQDAFATFGTRYIKNWTQQELKKYRSEPVVIPVGDYGFFIGPYIVEGIHKECWHVRQVDDRNVGDFINKSAAILYCLYSTVHKYSLANELLDLDSKLGRLHANIKNYEFSLAKAEKRNDLTKSTIMLNRYIDAKMQHRTYNNILKKTINSAKYLNFGKQPL
jgi:hypothetical protein